MTSGTVVRLEHPDDFPSVDQVVAAAFGSPAEARLVRSLRTTPGYRSDLTLVAHIDGSILGHVMLSDVWVHGDGESRHRVLLLSPLAVSPERQGKGIGSLLVNTAIRLADDVGESAVVLQGSPAYYGRFGFVPAIDHGVSMDLAAGTPIEVAQLRPLGTFDGQRRGHLVLPDCFNELD